MKTVIVGATGTIGNAVAQILNEKGYEVISASRNSAQPIDIENSKSINKFFDTLNQLDVLICTAGNASFGPFSTMTDEQIEIGLKSKLMGQINLCRQALSKLNPNGVIILTGGIFAHQPWPETTNIAMVNAALEGFVRALALELTEGKRILIVHPPLIKETAENMGMDGSHCPSALNMAQVYLKGMETKESGKALFF